MYIIDKTYFIREYAIPNTAELTGGNSEDLEYYIDEVVRRVLKNVLGVTLFSELDANVVNGVLKADAPQKWKDLVNGVDYNGKSWVGLKYTAGIYKGSLLVPAVFSEWLSQVYSQIGGVGGYIIIPKGGIPVNPAQRITRAWNDFVIQYQGDSRGRAGEFSYVHGVPFYDYFGGTRTGQVSLLAFLRDNSESYSNIAGMMYEFDNQLGI